ARCPWTAGLGPPSGGQLISLSGMTFPASKAPGTMAGVTGDEGVLERAVAELRAAQAAVIEARRSLSAVIVAERRAGVSVVDLAERTRMSPIDIRNLLGAAGL
ncbi:hypothetical protein, partial [Streptomyces sp. NPDC058572]|uniref:hypothetical protein n=1 Tax=Streptomyces sp. NPDC058572 TaxID=3346546 RepID=UPI00365503D2